MSHMDDGPREHTIAELRTALIGSSLASPDEVRGCTQDELSEVVAQAGDFKLPEDYVEFLKIMGHGAGRLLRGTGMFYPEPLTMSDYVQEFIADGNPQLRATGRFFFGHHQGYQLYFFERDRPTVFMYTEGRDEPELLADNFASYLWMEFESERRLSQGNPADS